MADDPLAVRDRLSRETLHRCTRVPSAEHVAAELRRASLIADPLAGEALVVKDNIHVAGLPNSAGTAALRDFVPEYDAGVVARLRARGMVVVAKSGLHELALGVTSTHGVFGDVVSSIDPARVAGGSSGGTAAIIGAGECVFGLGTDTGGSARIPAAYNDIWGFRPTIGRYAGDGVTSIAFSRDTVGVMGATLHHIGRLDAALAIRAPVERIPEAGTIRLGFDPEDMLSSDVSVAAAFASAIDGLRRCSRFEIQEVSLGGLDGALTGFEPRLGAFELAPSLGSYLAEHRLPSLSEVKEQVSDLHVIELIETSERATAEGLWTSAWHDLLTERERIRAEYLRLLASRRLSAVVRPTAPQLPALVGDVRGMSLDERGENFAALTRNTRLSTVVGSPSASIPLGPLTGHRMTGLLVDGVPGLDEELLALTSEIEAALRG